MPLTSIPMEHGLIVATSLFGLGLLGLLVRRNALFVLLSLEILMNAAGLAFVVAAAHWGQTDGQVMFLFVLAAAAAEVAVALALVLRMVGLHKTLDLDSLREMRG